MLLQYKANPHIEIRKHLDSFTIATVDQLMCGKTTPDVQFIHGITPLMISSSCGHTDIVEALIQSGANVNKTDEFGDTAIDYAKVAKKYNTSSSITI